MDAYVRYFGYFAWLLLMWYISSRNYSRVTRKEKIGDKTVTRYSWPFALAAALPLIMLAGTRSFYFGDTIGYKGFYESSAGSFSELMPYLNNVGRDEGFFLFTSLFKIFFGVHSRIYLFVISAFQGFAVTAFLRKYSDDFLLSLFIFVASNDFLSYMENGIRQFIAVCIILLGSKYIFERKYIPAIFIILIASQFHASALLMIPVIFIVQGQPWNKSTVLILVVALLAVIFTNEFTTILERLLEETQYSSIVSTWTSFEDSGTNPIRVIVFCVPAVLSLLGTRYIREENDPVINICTNMAIISAGLYIISMATSGIYMGRLPVYATLYANCILLPWEIKHFFNRDSYVFLAGAMVFLFMLFYYYQIHYAWSAF